MNKKIFTFMKQSNDSFKKDVYYRLLANSSYNWRSLLSLSSQKILSMLDKIQDSKAIKVFIIDDTVKDKVGKNVEGSCDSLWSNKEKRKIRGLNVVSLNYNDSFSNFMLDFDMVRRAVKSGIQADYLLVDSWYSKPVFIKEMNKLGLRVISRMTNSNKIWNFIGKEKLIPIVSTDLHISDEEVIEIYKRRWDIEQEYKELREHFGFDKEENRIYEALIARITLSFFSCNIVSYINRISNEPKV